MNTYLKFFRKHPYIMAIAVLSSMLLIVSNVDSKLSFISVPLGFMIFNISAIASSMKFENKTYDEVMDDLFDD